VMAPGRLPSSSTACLLAGPPAPPGCPCRWSSHRSMSPIDLGLWSPACRREMVEVAEQLNCVAEPEVLVS
jgi:hypothetical protein